MDALVNYVMQVTYRYMGDILYSRIQWSAIR